MRALELEPVLKEGNNKASIQKYRYGVY